MTLSTDELTLIEVARRFAAERVAPQAQGWESQRAFPVDALKEAAQLGLLGIETPKKLGGSGASFVAKLLTIEALAAECMAFTFSLVNTQNVTARIATSGRAHWIERYLADLLAGERIGATALTEPGAGSDFAAIDMTASLVEGGWRLNGEKAWITNAAAADLFVVYAQTDPSLKWRGIASFLVDARNVGFERKAAYELLGAHAIGVGGFVLQDFFVADEDLIAGPGEAFKNAMSGINSARTYVAGMCNAMVESSLKHALTYGTSRKVFGQNLLAHQGLRWKLADIRTQLEASRLLTYRSAQLIDAEEDAMMPAAHAKKFAAEYAVNAIADCIQFMGAEGLKSEYPLGRHLACAKIAAYTDGSTEIQNERIGASLLKEFELG